jgi:hypothetical protein
MGLDQTPSGGDMRECVIEEVVMWCWKLRIVHALYFRTIANLALILVDNFSLATKALEY